MLSSDHLPGPGDPPEFPTAYRIPERGVDIITRSSNPEEWITLARIKFVGVIQGLADMEPDLLEFLVLQGAALVSAVSSSSFRYNITSTSKPTSIILLVANLPVASLEDNFTPVTVVAFYGVMRVITLTPAPMGRIRTGLTAYDSRTAVPNVHDLPIGFTNRILYGKRRQSSHLVM
ncbi:hypothetical protein B0J17DRAFT_628570 [Rhizoctonia solani]|nr:hypothetical protein B0J17DRAFT_628570 [Rhizoctonia solani]